MLTILVALLYIIAQQNIWALLAILTALILDISIAFNLSKDEED